MSRLLALPVLAALAGCVAAPPQPPLPAAPVPAPMVPAPVAPPGPGTTYRCNDGTAFAAQFGDEAVQLHGLPGAAATERLLRDAGGLTPQHTVWSNPRLRAEFGLGPDGTEATLHPLQPPGADLRCQRS